MGKWTRVAHINEIPVDQLTGLMVNGQKLLIYRTDDGFHVYPDLCTHAAVPLSDGYLLKGTIICRLHGAKYDLRTGTCLKAPARANLQAYPTKVIDEALYIDDTTLNKCALPQPITIRSQKYDQRETTHVGYDYTRGQ